MKINYERKEDGYHKEDNNDPLQQLHSARGYLIRNLLVDAFERLQLSQNASVPFCKVKALGSQAIQSRQILVSQQLEDVVHSLEQDRIIHLPL